MMDIPVGTEKYPIFLCDRCVYNAPPGRFSGECYSREYTEMNHKEKLAHWGREGQCPFLKEKE